MNTGALRSFGISVCLLCAWVFAGEPSRTIVHYGGGNGTYFVVDQDWEPRDFDKFFVSRSVSFDPEANAMDYQLVSKIGKAYLLKYKRPRGITATQKLVVKMRNLAKEPLKVYVQWATCREATAGTSHWFGWLCKDNRTLPADGQWHELVFNTAPENLSYNAAATSNTPMYGPDGRIDIGFVAPPAGVEVHYQLAEIRGEDDATPTGAIQWNDAFPQEMTAGTPVHIPGFSVAFQGRAPFDQEAALVFQPAFKDDLWPTLTVPLESSKDGMAWSIPAQDVNLTPYLLDGEYNVTVKCGEGILENGSFKVKVNGRPQVGFRSMSVQEFGGRPTIFRDGEPISSVTRITYAQEGPKGVQTFTDCGVQTFGFCATGTEGMYDHSYTVEFEPGKFDYQQLDRRIRGVLDVNPDAMLNIRIGFHSPRWWSQEHMDDMAWTTDPKDPEGKAWPFIWHQGLPVPSWASHPWREYSKNGIRRLMDYLEQSPYADHLAGFVLASGTTEEWMEWGFNRGACPDYSPASQAAFRQWLTDKYGTDEALQTAWKDSAVTLATVTQPTAYQRSALLNYPGYMDPANPLARPIADYNRFHSENVAECIAEFCKEFKNATHGKLLVGAFYGYEVELAGTSRELMSGHIGVGSLLNCPDLDYLCSPTGYEYRQVGGAGMSYAMGPADSLQLHNKFWFIENDIRTSATHDKYYGCPEDGWGDVLQQTKESMHNLLSGMAQWWFDVGYAKFEGKELLETITKCVEIMDATTLEYTRKPVAQVAMVIDEESIDWTTQPTKQVGVALRDFQRTQLAPMGTPYEVYLSQDLGILPERIRILFLPMSLAWTPEHKAALDKFLSDGRVVCFIGTPGVIPPEGMTADESAQAFTGLPLKFRTDTANAECRIDHPDGVWMSKDARGQAYHNEDWKNSSKDFVQAVLGKGDDITILGHYIDHRTGQNTPFGALGVKTLPDATVLFSGVSNLPREFLVKAYEAAGVHRYVDTPDQVWATENVFAVCVNEAGSRLIRLPRKCNHLKDLMSGEVLPVDDEGAVAIQFLEKQTRVFLME